MCQDTRAKTWGVLMYKKVLSDVDIERKEIVSFYISWFEWFKLFLLLLTWGLMATIQRDIAPDCHIVREKKNN
jgi:hypothetical protein